MVRGVFRVLVVLWAGSLWSVLWVAAILFQSPIDRHVAGQIAARLFSIEAYIGLAVTLLALMLPDRQRYPLLYAAAAILSVNEWILKRAMNLAQTHGTAAGLSFGAWHGVSAGLYVLACLCIVIMIYKDQYRHA